MELLRDAVPTASEVTQQLKDMGVQVPDTLEDIPTVDVHTASEQEAIKKGWDPKGVKSADEFLRAEPLYAEIKASHKDVKELKKQVERLLAYNEQAEKVGYQRAMEELQVRRTTAIASGNVQAVTAVERQMTDLTEKQTRTTVSPLVQEFADLHRDWYDNPSDTYTEARAYLHKRDTDLQLLVTAGKITPRQHFDILTDDIHKKFPATAGNAAIGVVEVATAKVDSDDAPIKAAASTKAGLRFADLNADQKECCLHYEKLGLMTRDEFLAELQKPGTRRTVNDKRKAK